jgi:hypothetical protein
MKTPSAATVQPSAEPNSRSNTKAVLAFSVAPTNSVNAAPQVVAPVVAPPSAASEIAASSAKVQDQRLRVVEQNLAWHSAEYHAVPGASVIST